MKKPVELQWLGEPVGKDYDAAENYLQLLAGPKKARKWAKDLKDAEMEQYAARDVLRASGTPMSEVKAFDWQKQVKELHDGTPMSPILLIRQDDHDHLIIADGFHRVCATFSIDQDALIPCKIA